MLLSGPDTWDDLYIKIDTRANTSEFFFNGISFGTIAHDTSTADTMGSVRIERLDRSSAVNDDIYFDDLTLGPLDARPPPITIARSQAALRLSWPAIRMGARLESTTALGSPSLWKPYTGSIFGSNGANNCLVDATNGAGFYRLRNP